MYRKQNNVAPIKVDRIMVFTFNKMFLVANHHLKLMVALQRTGQCVM